MLNFGGVDVFSHELVLKTWAWILHLRKGQLIQSGPKITSYKQGSITALISGFKKNSYPYTRPVIGVPCPSMLSGPYCFSFEVLFVVPPGVFFGSEVSAKFFFLWQNERLWKPPSVRSWIFFWEESCHLRGKILSINTRRFPLYYFWDNP